MGRRSFLHAHFSKRPACSKFAERARTRKRTSPSSSRHPLPNPYPRWLNLPWRPARTTPSGSSVRTGLCFRYWLHYQLPCWSSFPDVLMEMNTSWIALYIIKQVIICVLSMSKYHCVWQAVKQLLELPLNLTIVSPAHTPNWDLVSDVVNSCSRIYRSPKQCRNRYENVIIPREEGKVIERERERRQSHTTWLTHFILVCLNHV